MELQKYNAVNDFTQLNYGFYWRRLLSYFVCQYCNRHFRKVNGNWLINFIGTFEALHVCPRFLSNLWLKSFIQIVKQCSSHYLQHCKSYPQLFDTFWNILRHCNAFYNSNFEQGAQRFRWDSINKTKTKTFSYSDLVITNQQRIL